MKYLLVLMASFLLMGCGTTMPHDKFFCTISTEDIPDVSEKSITYKTNFIDHHFVEAGTISDPLIDYDIKYDTLSHYHVIVFGRLVFGDSVQEEQYETIDSVGITRLVIMSLHSPRELYSKNGDEHWNDIPWKKCSLPKRILKKIKNDFLIRKKYTRIVFQRPDSIKGITTGYDYSLY